jgi:hypothetical protein
MKPMADRPCKPDADLKWLWRTLLGSTPLPVCGAPERANAAAIESTTAAPDVPSDAEARADRRVRKPEK